MSVRICRAPCWSQIHEDIDTKSLSSSLCHSLVLRCYTLERPGTGPKKTRCCTPETWPQNPGNLNQKVKTGKKWAPIWYPFSGAKKWQFYLFFFIGKPFGPHFRAPKWYPEMGLTGGPQPGPKLRSGVAKKWSPWSPPADCETDPKNAPWGGREGMGQRTNYGPR